MNALLARETVIAFALFGGAASVWAMLLQRRGRTGRVRSLNRMAYGAMAISMLLFIVNGFRAMIG